MCPNINLLKTYKVYPRKIDFNYMRDKFFIYLYLNPFIEYHQPLEIKVQNNNFCFAYQPIYLGKGTGAGYRHNQHLTAFLSGREQNQFKVQTFKNIADHMANAAAKQEKSKPWNWKEYQSQYIVILETFQNPKELLHFEMAMINAIGVQQDHTGPLANKIKNAYKFDNLSTGRAEVF
jgi:hypothetical protein